MRPVLRLSALALALACGAAPPAAQPTAIEPSPPPEPRPAAGESAAVRIPLTVRETAGVARRGEVLRSGIPLPRSLAVRDPVQLAVIDPAGKPVPAELQVLARWGGGRDDNAASTQGPIEWLLVSFPATVGAGKSAVYHLVNGGAAAHPPPPAPLKLTREGDRFTVDTGAAVFRFGGDAGALFDEVRLASGERLIGGGRMSARLGKDGGAAAPVAHDAFRSARIEHQGPLSAVVVVEGAYAMPPVGGGGLGSLRRYVFTAGSPTAIVRQSIAWEGSLSGGCNGCLVAHGAPNGVLLTGLRDELALALGGGAGGLRVAAIGGRKGADLAGAVAAGQEAAVRQLLRPDRAARLSCTVQVAGARAACQKADGGLLAASGPRGTVAIALNHMHRYEPQALRLLPDGKLAVDWADDKVWLAHHEGLFATFAVAALPPGERSNDGRRAELDRAVWAPLDHPLHAWPETGWFAASQAVPELPVGPLPRGLRDYDRVVGGTLKATLEHVDSEGLAGLMTFGVFPRYWGRWGSPEIECKKRDPTPGETWDDLFWCGTWTDYHNTLATAPLWAMRTGEVEWLDEVGFPGALRTLHTQIMQCAPGDRWFYCGQAPAGYGGYRADFNSSHAYFENLFLYYWLTGDSTVVATLRHGGETMRRWMCDLRGPERGEQGDGPAGPSCPADHPSRRAGFVGRVGSQWLAVFRFLGLASPDPSFSEDFRSGLARALTQQYAEPRRDGKGYGFLGAMDPKAPATLTTEQLWQLGLFDADNLYRFELDSGDEAIGQPPLKPSRVLAALARTIVDVEPRARGDRGLRGRWPLQLKVSWTGDRIGGELASAAPLERDLYGPEKSCMASLLMRAGRQTGDRALLDAGREVVELTLGAAGGEILPLGKLDGQYLSRLHSAVAALASGERRDEPVREARREGREKKVGDDHP
jgi:hypothetical protein